MFRIEFLQLSLNLVLLKFKKHELSCGFVNITGVRGPRKVECLVTSHIKISMELFPAEPPRTISTDEQMVECLRKNLIDISAPNPSVETLVHATIKEKFVDHTHSNAILEITNRPEGLRVLKELFGKN